jgi:exopolyphosphatase/guanosine-5'-triphosphate,3'-diphosphate pyrophosphatase
VNGGYFRDPHEINAGKREEADMGDREGSGPRTVAFIDIGTNSIRLLVVRINPNGTIAIQSRQKETVRLGEGEFGDQSVIQPGPMERAVMIARRFRDMAAAFGATEFVAVATSATREAKNRAVFLERLRLEALLDVHPVSGREEARLTYLGVAPSLQLGGKKGLFIDIGGGSTEIAVGDGEDPAYIDSLKLGGIRLANLFPGDGGGGPYGKKTLREMRGYIGDVIVRTVQSVKRQKVDLAVGSSGTIENLGEIGLRNFPQPGQVAGSTLSLGQLRSIITLLSGMTLGERKGVAGMNPERADIIIPGAAILESFMEALNIGSIRISERGLQDGLLEDYLSRLAHPHDIDRMGARERSVLRLARSCGVDEGHARSTRALSLQLFDSARGIGLHDLGERERELLGFAALLHDTGKFISFANHHDHSYYVVRNADLLGFDDTELAIMANVVRVHRKKFPARKFADCDELDGRSRKLVRILGMFLRIAESLDRSHAGLVRKAWFAAGENGLLSLEFEAEDRCDLEIWAAEKHRKAFTSIFRRELVISPRCGPGPGTGTRG